MKPSGCCGHCYWLTTAIVTASTFGNPASLNLIHTITAFQPTVLQLLVTRIAFIPSSSIPLRALAHIHQSYFLRAHQSHVAHGFDVLLLD
jgi:hypothetical protein